MSRYRLFHTLIVLVFTGCLLYGLTARNELGVTITVTAAIIGTILVIVNHKMNRYPKSEAE